MRKNGRKKTSAGMRGGHIGRGTERVARGKGSAVQQGQENSETRKYLRKNGSETNTTWGTIVATGQSTHQDQKDGRGTAKPADECGESQKRSVSKKRNITSARCTQPMGSIRLRIGEEGQRRGPVSKGEQFQTKKLDRKR